MIKTKQEIGTGEASRVLGIHRSNVVMRALEVDTADAIVVRATLRAKRLPGRKVGRFWLFRRADVLAFSKIDRPTGNLSGRPRRNVA